MKPYIVLNRNIELFHNLNSSPLDCDQTNSCHTQIDAWCGGFRWNLECDSSQNLVTLNYVISGSPKPSINYKLMWRVREWTFSARELTLWIICHFLWTDIHCQAWPVLSWDYLHVYPQIVFPRKLFKEKKNGKIPIPEQNLRMTIERGFLLQIPILSFPIFAGLRSSCIWAGWLRADQASWKVEFGLSSIKLGTISLSLIHIWELRSDKGRWAVSE